MFDLLGVDVLFSGCAGRLLPTTGWNEHTILMVLMTYLWKANKNMVALKGSFKRTSHKIGKRFLSFLMIMNNCIFR